MLSINRKQVLPHIVAVLVFFIITSILFYPSLFGGKELYQYDILQSKGVSHQTEALEDVTGEEVLWLTTIFSGMPAYLNGADFDYSLIKAIHFIVRGGLTGAPSTVFISLLGFYILLLSFRVDPWLSILGALAFGLNGFTIISLSAGHTLKVLAVALMPFVLAGVHLAFTGKRILGFIITTLALALELYTNHLQITYYLLIMVIGYGIYQIYLAYRDKAFKSFLTTMTILLGSALLALGMNTGKLWTLYEYSPHSIRGKSALVQTGESVSGLGKDYAFQYSNGIFEPLVLFIPGILGGSSSQELSKKSEVAETLRKAGYQGVQLENQLKSIPTYWGNQPLTAPYYAGAIPIFLFILSLFVIPNRHKSWLIGLLCLAILLSYGKNFESFNYFIFDHLPLYNKFRSVTFVIIIPIVCIYILGFYGLNEWLKSTDKKKQLFRAFGIAGGITLFLILIAGFLSYRGQVDSSLPDWFVTALREDRKSMLRTDAFVALLFVTLAASLLWLYSRQKVTKQVMLLGIGSLIVFDMLSEAKNYISQNDFKKNTTKSYFTPTEADQYIMNNTSSGERVLNLQNPFNEARTSYFHESIGGYHPAKMGRYQDLIENCLHSELNSIITSLKAGKKPVKPTPALDMLNTKFFMAGNTRNAVILNSNSLGNVWLANKITYVSSADEEIAKTCVLESGEAVIDRTAFNINLINPAQGEISLLERNPDLLKYTADVSGEALAIFSEIYYPEGWEATIDGKKVDVIRANYLLRALVLPEGKHIIEFSFKPKSYYTSQVIMTSSSILFILISVLLLAIYFYRNKKLQ